MAELYSRLFLDGESAPPPDLPYGQFRMEYLRSRPTRGVLVGRPVRRTVRRCVA